MGNVTGHKYSSQPVVSSVVLIFENFQIPPFAAKEAENLQLCQ